MIPYLMRWTRIPYKTKYKTAHRSVGALE